MQNQMFLSGKKNCYFCVASADFSESNKEIDILNVIYNDLANWHCDTCKNVTRRYRKDDTPVRTRTNLNKTTMSIDDLNITENNTVCTEAETNIQPNPNKKDFQEDTLEKIAILLDRKFEENKQDIMDYLREIIKKELYTATEDLKQNFTKTTDIIKSEQLNLKLEIDELNRKIQSIEEKNNKIKQELEQLMYTHKEKSTTTNKENCYNCEYEKKIVIYGLRENYEENGYDLHEKIETIFCNTMNVDISGYIEDLKRLGKRGSRRPILMELISKRMEKRLLRNSLLEARKKGLHAVIQNNKLIINGKPQLLTEESQHNINISLSTRYSQNNTPNNSTNTNINVRDSSNMQIPSDSNDHFRDKN
ncbi:unnamed protein product [Diatraea saccharalis]|uniref:Uncharacterized protein n=1 Tax=Diatraea saccharalis TaxID=40085 RepID=A0A9N9WCX2_9NEOP|nr:unnamed protein product [Diatraea saccharalis]